MRVERLPCPPLPAGRRNLLLSGFMGTGKTTVGRAVAGRLGVPFFDLDQELERAHGGSVAELVGRLGEPGFRGLEARVMTAASRLSGAVVATGGGAVLHEAEFQRLRSSAVSVVLSCSADELERRLAAGGGSRPLVASRPWESRRLLEERAARYAAAGEAVDTTGRTPAETAAVVAARYGSVAGTPAEIGVGDGWVVVGEGAASGLGALFGRSLPDCERAVVVSDGAVAPVQGRACAAALREAGLTVSELVAPPGEAGKRLAPMARLWRQLIRAGVDRQDAVVAVGGGATMDMVGMAAATFARGVPLVNVPTTLLGMADAGIGGKVAIDLGGTKNAVGCFHPARLVVCDPQLLSGLAPEVLRQGLSEILKCGLLGSSLTAARFGELAAPGSAGTLAFLVEQAVRVKVAHVAVDPHDLGQRLALNLGHTFAHGVESASRFSIPHGEAVAMGLVAAARLGSALGVSPAGLGSWVAERLTRAGLPATVPAGLSPGPVRRAFGTDKKRRSGRSRWVVPAAVGDGAQLASGVGSEEALSALFGGRTEGPATTSC